MFKEKGNNNVHNHFKQVGFPGGFKKKKRKRKGAQMKF